MTRLGGGPKETVWELEPHTSAKHELLRRYLGAWFPKLASTGFHGRLLFLDGFAGPGVYAGGELGSPILALQTLIDHPHFDRWAKTEFRFVFFEPDPERHQSLLRALEAFFDEQGGEPKNVKVDALETSFVDGATEVLTRLNGRQLAPTFALVDPFGFKGVPLDLIRRLLAFDRCEVFFNFMIDQVNRWVEHPDPKIRGHLEDLFGTTDYVRAAECGAGDERRQFLHDLYEKQLRAHAGFPYVHSFQMINRKNRPLYFMFYGTRHIEGVRAMKSAMWSVDRSGGVAFSDRLAGQEVLFAGDAVDVGPLRAAIMTAFAGKDVPIEQIEEFVLTKTPYAESHFRKLVLDVLERHERLITVVSSPRKRNYGYPPRTVIRFPPA